MHIFNNETRTHQNKTYRIDFAYDTDQGPPWDNEDGHGPVSDWTTRDKSPGERLLHQDGPFKRYYDWQAAIKTAKQDCWDAPPYGTGTKGQQAVRAVEADFRHLRDWCNDQWHYIGIIVTERRTDSDGFEYDGPSASLWGIESDCEDYHQNIIKELLEELQ